MYPASRSSDSPNGQTSTSYEDKYTRNLRAYLAGQGSSFGGALAMLEKNDVLGRPQEGPQELGVRGSVYPQSLENTQEAVLVSPNTQEAVVTGHINIWNDSI